MQAMIDSPEEASTEAAPAAAAAPVAEPAKAAEPGDPTPPSAVDVAVETAKLRKGWAALARDKEMAVRKVEQANAALKQAESLKAKADFLDTLPAKLKSDPLAFLEANGIAIDDLLNRVIDSEKSPVEKEIANLKKDIADREAAARRAQEEATVRAQEEKNNAIIADWAARNTAFAQSDPERYDLIVSLDQGEAVHQTCLAYHKKYNVILDAQTAADYVEKGLRAGVEKSKFVKSKIAASQPAPVKPAPAKVQPSQAPKIAPKQSGTTVTLSSVASGDGGSSTESSYPTSSDERFDAVLREMQAEGSLPDAWRVS
jgi:hypothetical protein